MISLRVNGRPVTLDGLPPEMPLLWALRDHLGLTGTRFGCGMAQCGACTVHLDGRAVRSCQLQIGTIEGRSVTTIEGLSADCSHPLQRAWAEHRVAQCGYCQAGQLMSAAALLATNPAPDDAAVQGAMNGNICRCGTYPRICAAIASVARAPAPAGGRP